MLIVVDKNYGDFEFDSQYEVLDIPFSTVNEALEFCISKRYEYETSEFLFSKDCFSDSFFDLKTKILGEFTQKLQDYGYSIRVFGKIESGSKAFHDYLYECSKGGVIQFFDNLSEAMK